MRSEPGQKIRVTDRLGAGWRWAKAQCPQCSQAATLKLRRGETLESLSETLACRRCGASGVRIESCDPPPSERIAAVVFPALWGAGIALAIVVAAFALLRLEMPFAGLAFICAAILAFGALYWAIHSAWDWETARWAAAGAAVFVVAILPTGIAVTNLFVGALDHQVAENLRLSPNGGYYGQIERGDPPAR